MKKTSVNIAILVIITFLNCKHFIVEDLNDHESFVPNSLPFHTLKLSEISELKGVGQNWSIVGQVHSDFTQELHMETKEGTGVLINQPTTENRAHIFSSFEHGDIELDLEFMIPKGSNSGIYFQSRYEIQLLDSWGKESLPQKIVEVFMRDGMIKNQKKKKAMRDMPPKKMQVKPRDYGNIFTSNSKLLNLTL